MENKINSLSFNQTQALNRQGKTASDTISAREIKLKKACQDFEAIFISYLYKSMRGETGKDGLFGKGLGNDLFQDLFDAEMAKNIASGEGICLAERLYRNFNLGTIL